MDLCDKAVQNIADAFCLLSSDNWSVFSSPAELRRNYLRMSFTVRRGIERAIQEGSIGAGP